MKKSLTFLIPNVTSAANIGDEAMLEVLMSLIKSVHPSAAIFVHSSEPHTHLQKEITAARPTLYYWAVFTAPNVVARVYRMFLVVLLLFALLTKSKTLVDLVCKASPVLKAVVADYAAAEVIVFVGGGYLRSNSGFTQDLNLLMLLLPFALATFFSGKKIVAPISIGPFAHSWHARIVGLVLQKFEYVAVREKFSYALMEKVLPHNLHLASDHALLLSRLSEKKHKTTVEQPVVGFTIRNWLDAKKQVGLEAAYTTAFVAVHKKTPIRVQPIVQVNAPGFGEDDASATARVAAELTKQGCTVLPTVTVQNVEHGKQVYGELSVLVGMRMHSNIFAGTQGTPFVPVSYEYKTEGISEDFGVAELCLRSADLTAQQLERNLLKVLTNTKEITRTMADRVAAITKYETTRWKKLLSV